MKEYIPFDRDDIVEIISLIGHDIEFFQDSNGITQIINPAIIPVVAVTKNTIFFGVEEKGAKLGTVPIRVSLSDAFNYITIDGHPFGKEK